MKIMRGTGSATLAGIGSVLFWSTTIAFSRSLTERLGVLDAAFFTLLASGILLFLMRWVLDRKIPISSIRRIPPWYFYKVGTFFILNMVLIYPAIGMAGSRKQVVIVGIINYLWPGFTFLFSVFILKYKARYVVLVTGMMIAFIGMAAAVVQGSPLSWNEIGSALKGNLVPYICVFLAAASWGVYSNVTRKFNIKDLDEMAAISMFLLISALVILVIQLLAGRVPRLPLTGRYYLEFAFMVIFPSSLAFLFWDIAMKRGDKNLVVALSFLIPLVSTLISGYYLKVEIGLGFWLAALLVILGAALCRISVSQKPC